MMLSANKNCVLLIPAGCAHSLSGYPDDQGYHDCEFAQHEARIGLRRLEEYGIHVRFPKYALSGVSYPRTRQESRRLAGCTDMVFCAT